MQQKEEAPNCRRVTEGGVLRLIERMGGFIGTILAVTTTMCVLVWAASHVGLVNGEARPPNPAAAAAWWEPYQPAPTSRPLVTLAEGTEWTEGNEVKVPPVHLPPAGIMVAEGVMLFHSPTGDTNDYLSSSGPRQVPEINARLLEDVLEQLKSMSKNVSRLEKMTIAKYPRVKFRTYQTRKRILVTGGAGFVGSHLVDRLMLDGHEVTVVDNLQTGRRRNIETWLGHNNFQFVTHDIVMPFFAEVDQIYHLASPASPLHYMANPVKTIKTNALGTLNMLGLAKRMGARLLLASSSDVYGDPEVHPQPETYWGNVNPIGPRACYGEGKRVAETLAFAYLERDNVSIAIARIFDTYGPRMQNNDGRAVSNFIVQAMVDRPLTVFGSGQQTRSFQYVSDLVEGLVALMESNHTGPVNIGNPDEHNILEFGKLIQKLVGGSDGSGGLYSHTHTIFGTQQLNSEEDDPQRLQPDISLAKKLLNWQPKVLLTEGIKKTIKFYRHELQRKHNNQRNTYDPLLDWPHISGDCTEEDGTCQEA